MVYFYHSVGGTLISSHSARYIYIYIYIYIMQPTATLCNYRSVIAACPVARPLICPVCILQLII